MRTAVLALALALVACGDDGNSGGSDANTNGTPDAPEFAPTITSLIASPNPITTPGVPTMVTFTWTLLVMPTYPEPTCTMDNGVGPVTSGTPVSLTLSQQTLFTLTCENRAGKSERQVLVRVPPSAPVLSSFTVSSSPSPVVAGQPATITFTWSYSNVPSPAPTCSVDGGVTNVTSATGVSMTLEQARTFRLRCTNGVGAAVYSGTIAVPDVFLPVNECGTPFAQCDAHATCTDTASSYTCACNSGYSAATSADGEVCLFNTTTATDCDQTNCPLNGTRCVPNVGYFGSGAVGDCKRARFTFVTSTVGNGNIGSWANATGTGLAAADSICNYRAGQAGLPGTYVAWMSDVNNDAYCRATYDPNTGVHMNGKKVGAMCGQSSLPATAGPWVRVGNGTTGYKQWSPTIDKLLAPNRITYYAANTDETGAEIASTTDRVWTGTDENGVYVANATCGAQGFEWTSSSSSLVGAAGHVWGGGTSWTHSSATDPNCLTTAHLRCVEVSGTASPVLPPRHPTTTKKAFLTSVTGNGYLSMWPDAYGSSSTNAPDQICKARARYAGYPNPETYKAWWTYYSLSVTSRITNVSAGYARPDGVILGLSKADMLDGKLAGAWEQTETNTYPGGSLDAGGVWTGMNASGGYYSSSSIYSCATWSYTGQSYYGVSGRFDLLDSQAMFYSATQYCDNQFRFYCVED